MADSDDFHYDSVVSDTGTFSDLLASTRHTDVAHGTPPHTPPRAPERGAGHALTDSMPSLAVSTPTAERFQFEYDRERSGFDFGSSQSQGGLKSGVYTNNSVSDFTERLRGEVVVSEKWSAVGSQHSPQHAADDAVFDMPPLGGPMDTTHGPLSADDSQATAQQEPVHAAGPDERRNASAPSSPTGPRGAAADEPPATPKMTRSQSDRRDSTAPGLRSALRRSRPAPLLAAGDRADSEAAELPRKVSFAGFQPLASPEVAVGASDAPSADPKSTSDSGGQVAAESIVFGAHAAGDGTAAKDMSTQPLDATGSGDTDDLEPSRFPAADTLEPATDGAARQGISATTGVGMTGGMFSRFAGWTRNQLVSRSPNNDAVASGSAGAPQLDSIDSSQSASTVSSVKTEPMRSQVLSSSPTTPVPNSANGTARSSARKTLQTPSRSVNPLTRHLAMKAMQLTPGWSPTARVSGGTASPLADSSSGSLAGSADSAILGLAELQRQFDGFAGQLQRDASAAHAEVQESEQAWLETQSELQALRAQLADAEAAQDLLQQQQADADRERVEWEQERERLEEDNAALQAGVDRWRQRIGDAEVERQGAWEEGAQSRQQLLRTIVQLEEELAEARGSLRQAGALRNQAAAFEDQMAELQDEVETQRREMSAKWEADRHELLQDMEDIMAAYDGLEAERNRLQADLGDRQVMLDDAAARAAAVSAEYERQLAEARAAQSAATARADALDNANELLRETLSDLTAQNRELKKGGDDSVLFATAIGDDRSDGSRSGKNSETGGEAGQLARLRQEHRDELERVNNDYQMLVETMEGLNESKNRYKTENAELAATAEAARNEICTLRAQLEGRGVAGGPSDELAQRAARLETELADLRGSGEAAELQRENAYLQTMVGDLEQQLRRSHEESDALRQAAAAIEVQLDDAQGELAGARERLAALQASNAQLSDEVAELRTQAASKAQSPQVGPRHVARELELKQESRRMQASVAALEATIQQATQRRSLLEKEQRLLASGLRDSLLHNATLRTEMTEIILRRAGLARGLNRPGSQLGGEGDASMASGLLSHVPPASQLLDGSSRFVRSLDRHLDEVANIVEDDVAGGAARRRPLAPIREEPRRAEVRDAATQSDRSNDTNSDSEMAALRASLASARQERDQFRASHEEAAERESRLAVQMEELSEDHERGRAERITTARVALRVGRQLAVLRRALERLAAQQDGASTAVEPDDGEDEQAINEESEMISAAFDRPLDAGDCELFGLPADADAADARDRMGRGELSCDHALDRIGQMVSQAHLDLRRLRRDVLRARRERARLLRRVADSERRKLPSYELSAMWGRSCVDDLDDADPPASLLLADESAVVAEVTAARRADQAAPAPRDRVSAVAEITRLTALLARREKRLRAAEADVAKVEELNRELVQRLDRAFAERVRAQQECTVTARRASVRSVGRVTTPGGATDWDDVESIMREMDRCARHNTAYFGGVEQLCGVLSQHAATGALVPAPEAAPSMQALLDEVASVLDARGDLDERRPAHENFMAMAAAVRRRLDAAQQPAAAAELGAQIATAQEHLTKHHATIRSLNNTISELRQQLMRTEGELHDARMDRDGWHKQCEACDNTLAQQIDENNSLRRGLNEARNAQLSPAGVAALCQSYEAQIEISAWAARTWSAVVRAIAAPGAPASAHAEALCSAADELDAGVDRATRRVRELHDTGRRDDDRTEALDQVVTDLGRDFAGGWRDRVRGCIVALAAAASSAPATPPTTESGSSSRSSPEAGQPRVSAQQKAMIRDHYARREQELRNHLKEKLAVERKATAERTAKYERERRMLVAEKQYLRGRINIVADQLNCLEYQKRCLLDVLGGHQGLFRRIDETPGEGPADPARDLVRWRWRRVLLFVRMKNRLLEMAAKSKETADIKASALKLWGAKSAAMVAPPAVAVTTTAATAAPPERGPILGVRFQTHHPVSLRAAPVTPSRLRNRSSDVASSTGSSV